MCVNAIAVEYSIADTAVNIQLPRKPRYCSTLRTQFFLNNMPDVNGFCHTVCGFMRLLLIGIQVFARTHKKTWTFLIHVPEVLRKPVLKDKSRPRYTQTFTTCSYQYFFEISQVSETLPNK